MRHKWFFLVGVTAVMYASPSFAQEAAFEAYHDSVGEVVQLSSQASDPFLFLGKKVEAGHPLAEKYAKSLRKFPTVQSCLLKTERDKVQPDLTQFDWDKLQNNEDAEVCLFRVAASYSTMEAMHKWLQIHGFESKMFTENETITPGISATISFSDNWPKYESNFFSKAWIKLIAHGLAVSIAYKENKIQNIGCTYNIL